MIHGLGVAPVSTAVFRAMRRLVAVGLTLATITGCASLRLPWPGMRQAAPSQYTEGELRADLDFFADRYNSAIIVAADRIARVSTDREIRKATVLWKLRLLPVMQELAFLDDPQEAFASVLTLAIATRRYLETGEGASIFGEHQHIAVKALRELEEEAISIGRNFIEPEKLARIATELDEIARENPVRGVDFSAQRLQRAVSELDQSGSLGTVLNAPLAPFRALEGVSSGATAIREFNRTAEEFAQIVSSLPRQLRWETQLLLYDIEDRDTVVQALAAVESAAASADRVAGAADRLPDDVRMVLGETEPALTAANEVLATIRELLGPLRTTAEQLRLASASWQEILVTDTAPGPEARPFDVREWERTFGELATAATDLRALTRELQTASNAEHLGQALGAITATIDDAEARARAIVDLAAWRVLELLLAAFVLFGLYRLITRRTAR